MRFLSILLVACVLAVVSCTTATAGDRVDRMTQQQLAKEARKLVKNGHILSIRWGGATRYLTRICYELVERAFRPYGTEWWAIRIVRRESGCNPGAVNTTYSAWEEQARTVAQLIPRYHTWVDYKRAVADPAYGVAVFVRLSKGGRNTQPWCLC